MKIKATRCHQPWKKNLVCAALQRQSRFGFLKWQSFPAMISLLVDYAFQIVWRWCYRMFQFQQLQWSKYLVEHPCRVIGWCGTISESTENFQKLSNGNPEHFQIEDKICLWSSTQVRRKLFFNAGSPKEDIFLTSIYGLYFSHHHTHITNYNLPHAGPRAAFMYCIYTCLSYFWVLVMFCTSASMCLLNIICSILN